MVDRSTTGGIQTVPTVRQRAGPNRPPLGALLESGSLPLFLSLVSPPAPYQLNTV